MTDLLPGVAAYMLTFGGVFILSLFFRWPKTVNDAVYRTVLVYGTSFILYLIARAIFS